MFGESFDSSSMWISLNLCHDFGGIYKHVPLIVRESCCEKEEKKHKHLAFSTCRCPIHHLNSSFSFHPVMSLPWKNLPAFPWVQYFIQISRGILSSPEGKNFCLKTVSFSWFSVQILIFLSVSVLIFAASQKVTFIIVGKIAYGTLRKLWLDTVTEICLGLLPLFELL